MSKGTYTEFRDALRAFESGWDRDRYEAGVIADWQLDQWAGGTVEETFPGAGYSSWGDLSAAEWDAMSYRSMNSLGFVGYQFGEALLIDLGYYEDDQFYGNGASTNTWDGTWTGKNGVNSLEDFMTKAAQEQAIQEAFGYNTRVITEGLKNAGKTLDEYLGTTRTYQDGGQEITVELTMTGILAAAHLRGAWGTLNLLLNDSVSTDEYGTSILRYIDQFGGFDSPTQLEVIQVWDAGYVLPDGSGGNAGGGETGGDTGGGTGGDTGGDTGGNSGGGQPAGSGSAGVTKDTADVVITWSWGQDSQVTDFDPTSSTIFIDWIGADALEVSETAQGVVFAVPSNNQSTTLVGVTLDQLSAANFTILDATAESEVLGLVGAGGDTGGGDMGGGDTGGGDMGGGDHGGGDHGGGDTGGGDMGGGDHGGGDTGGGDMGGGDHGGGDHGGGHDHMHVTIGLDTPAQTIDGFMPAMGDVIEITADVTAEAFNIFEESGDALGQTVRIEITNGGSTSQIILTGFGLDDLSVGNFSVADQGVLNEVASALGSVIVTPGDGAGYTLSYDSDGSNPPASTGATDQGGVKYRADSNADDIVGFDPAKDELDFGGTSVHGMIVTMSEAGEIVIDSPWSDAAQIVQGVTYQDVTIENFGIVGNEHFRQDMGGVVSWEQGVGPREADTVYVRSHEYGVHEVVDGFDPASMKLSFLYFGTRERLLVEDTEAGLRLSVLPSGQSLTLTDVQKADLIPGMVEFHFDQVMEDNLEDPFGFDQNDVTLVDRTMLLTPEAPAGASTDGYQTRTGDMTGSIYEGDGGDTGGGDTGGGDTGGGDTGGGDTGGGNTGGGSGATPSGGDVIAFGPGADSYSLSWSWGKTTTITGFDPAEDVIDFNSFNADQLAVSELDGDLVIEVVGNGGDFLVLDGIQAEDLSRDNLTAPGWSTILDEDSALIQALQSLGFSDLG